MKNFRKIIRLIILTLLLVLACAGIGFVPFPLKTRERSLDNEVKIELVEEKKNEEETVTEAADKT